MKKTQNTETTNRNSKFDCNRTSYMDEHGNYVYFQYVKVGKKWTREIIDIIPAADYCEINIMLDQDDHADDLQQRYAEENADYVFRNEQKRYEDDPEEHLNPMEQLQAYGSSLEDRFEQIKEVEDPRMEKLREFMATLNQEQIDLIYAVFGEMKEQTEIAKEAGVSKQAINGRLKKILARGAKAFGIEPPKKQTHRKKK